MRKREYFLLFVGLFILAFLFVEIYRKVFAGIP